MPLLEEMGLTADNMKEGINGLLKVLVKGTRTTTAPTAEQIEAGGWLMAVSNEKTTDATTGLTTTSKVTSTTEAAKWVIDGKTYYIKDIGMLTQTFYNMFWSEDDPTTNGFLEWLSWSADNGGVGVMPLTIPVNRFMATGSLKGGDHPNSESITIQGVYGAVKNYHIYADAGASMLTLLRWLLDDGTLYVLTPLLEGLLGGGDSTEENSTSVLDTILAVLDGQADNLMAIIICLLNEYNIDYDGYLDPAKDYATWGQYDAEGNNFTAYLNADGTSKFKVGKFLTETLSQANEAVTDPNNATDAQLLAKADLAVSNADKLINSLISTIFIALENTLSGVEILQTLGIEDVIAEVKEGVDSGDKIGLEEVVTELFINNELIEVIVDLLVGTKELVYLEDANGDKLQATTTNSQKVVIDGKTYYMAVETKEDENLPTDGVPIEGQYVVSVSKSEVTAEDGTTTTEYSLNYDNGVLGGLFSDPDSILVKLVDALGEYELDLSPAGFYKAFTSTTNSSQNTQLAQWLERQAWKHLYGNLDNYNANTYDDATVTQYIKENMTWGDISYEEGYEWFVESDDIEERYDNFGELLCDLLSPLNPVLTFLLSGQNITLFDELAIQGNNGYSRAVVVLFEMLGLDEACMSQNQFDYFVFKAAKNADPSKVTNTADVVVDDLAKAQGTRFANTVNSPLKPLMTALKTLLVGDENNNVNGLLDTPLTVLFEKIPNIAYGMYVYTNENGTKTSSIATAIKNLIAPITKLLDIVDPVLSRVVSIDINGLIDSFLDMESLLNTLVGSLVGNDDTTVNIQIFNFGKVAAESVSNINFNATTYRAGDDDGKFTKFEGSAGKLFITLMRTILTKDIVATIGDLVANIFGVNDPTQNVTDEEKEASERIINIVKAVETNLCKDAGEDADGGMYVDILTGIIIDVLTDYIPSDGEYYYYELINAVDEKLTQAIQDQAMEDYGIEHDGYDWEATKDNFTEAEVNEAIENLDYVIQKAIPDVISALQEEGMIAADFDVDFSGGNGLWVMLQGLLEGLLLKDDMLDTIGNLVCKLLGSSGDTTTTGNLARALQAAGFDMTFDAFLYNADDSKTAFYNYITYGFAKDSDGNLKKGASGDMDMYYLEGDLDNEVELTWAQIYKNHSYTLYSFDENGVLEMNADGTPKLAVKQTAKVDEDGNTVIDEDGNTVYEDVLDENKNPVYETALLSSGYKQVTKTGDNGETLYVYTYTDADGKEQEYTSEYQQLKVLDSKKTDDEGKAIYYTLTAKYEEDTANRMWSWGIDTITGKDDNETFNLKKSKFLDIVWEMISPFASIFSMLLAGDALKLFDDTLNIEGEYGYERVLLPLLRAFGLETVLDYLVDKDLLDDMNADHITGDKIPANLMTNEAFLEYAYDDNGKLDVDGLGSAMKQVINYVFYFVEILATYPIETLSTGLPTLAYFIYADGLTTLISNLLIPITTLTDRLQEIINLDINNIGAGLIDMLATGSWESFQEALGQFIQVDEEGNIITSDKVFSLTDSLLSLLANLEFDLKGILAGDDDNVEEGEYKYSIILFLDKDVEHAAKAKIAEADALAEADADANADEIETLRKEAKDSRLAVLKNFFKSLAALGDPNSEHSDEANDYIVKNYSNYVFVSTEGQVVVSKAEVLMWLLDFLFTNETLKDIIGQVLGYDITDDNSQQTDVELLDEIITNVFTDYKALVELVVALLVDYDVQEVVPVSLLEIQSENHFNFYEDQGFSSHEDVLAYNKNLAEGEEKVTEISRVKTSATIDNLDNLVGTILNLFKEDLT